MSRHRHLARGPPADPSMQIDSQKFDSADCSRKMPGQWTAHTRNAPGGLAGRRQMAHAAPRRPIAAFLSDYFTCRLILAL